MLRMASSARSALPFLNEPDQCIDDDDTDDHACIHPMLQQGSDQRGKQQDVDEEVVELVEKADQRTRPFGRRQSILTVSREPLRGLIGT